MTPETGWPSYTPRNWVHILVAFYDMHGLQWDSLIPATTREPTGHTRIYFSSAQGCRSSRKLCGKIGFSDKPTQLIRVIFMIIEKIFTAEKNMGHYLLGNPRILVFYPIYAYCFPSGLPTKVMFEHLCHPCVAHPSNNILTQYLVKMTYLVSHSVQTFSSAEKSF
jgi:hypothetical protein